MFYTSIRDLLVSYKWLFLAVFITRLALLMYVFPDSQRIYNGDSALYEQYALSILETGEYLAYGYASSETDPFADMIRPPGYPGVMWMIYALVGPNAGPWVMAFLSGIMSLFTLVCLILFIHLLGVQHAKWTLWLFVVDPVWLLYSKEILTEPFFVPLILFGTYFGLIALARLSDVTLPGDGQIALHRFGVQQLMMMSGLLFGVATLFKPITLYVPFAAVILLIILYIRHELNNLKRHKDRKMIILDLDEYQESAWGKVNFKKWFMAGILFFLTSQSMIFTWQYRNYLQHGTFAFTSIQAENMMTGHAAFVLAKVKGITHLDAQNQIRTQYNKQHPNHGRYNFSQLSSAKSEVASQILSDHKWVYTESILKGMAITLFDPGRLVTIRTFGNETASDIGLTNTIARDGFMGALSALLKQQPGMSVFLIVHLMYLAVIFVLSVIGFYQLCRKYPVVAIVLGCFFLYLWVLGGPSGYARFRLYLSPFMFIFISFLPPHWFSMIHRRFKKE